VARRRNGKLSQALAQERGYASQGSQINRQAHRQIEQARQRARAQHRLDPIYHDGPEYRPVYGQPRRKIKPARINWRNARA
jgi:hypothetical protein